MNGQTREAINVVSELFNQGYAATDIIQTFFRVTRSHEITETLKLEYIREIGLTHLRIAEGLNSKLQLLGCVARMCRIINK